MFASHNRYTRTKILASKIQWTLFYYDTDNVNTIVNLAKFISYVSKTREQLLLPPKTVITNQMVLTGT